MSIPLMYREEFSAPCIISKDDMAETFTVKRTQRIYHPYDKFISYFCHLSKNLWNQAHHIIYRYYKEHNRVPSYEELDCILNKKSYYKDENGKINPDFDNYHKLGGTTAQQILRVYMKEWKSFLKGIAGYWKNKKNNGDKDYTGMPREPGYKEKDGEFIIIFTNKQIKFTEKKDGSVWMTFQKTIDKQPSKLKSLKILLGNTNELDSYLLKRLMFGKFNIVRIIPQGIGYTIEIVYDQEVLKNAREIYHLNENIIMSIDTGVDNLITITDNIGSQPIIIKSEIWKAENQWYNKRRAGLSSVYDRQHIGCKLPEMDKNTIDTNTPKRKFKTGFIGKYIIGEYNQKIGCKLPKKIGDIIDYITRKNGKKIKILTENRNHFVMDSQHKVSRFIIERALDIKAGTVVFGKNPLWKQKVNIGKRNNQNFAQIPHAEIIDKTRYKGGEVGIIVIDQTEEYTSKCSFLGSEKICFHTKYMGERIYRGLFKCSKGVDISAYTGNKKEKIIYTINTDAQGSYNILRNVDPRFSVLDIMEGVATHGLVPIRLSISNLMTKSYQQLRMSHRLKVGVDTLVENINNINN